MFVDFLLGEIEGVCARWIESEDVMLFIQPTTREVGNEYRQTENSYSHDPAIRYTADTAPGLAGCSELHRPDDTAAHLYGRWASRPEPASQNHEDKHELHGLSEGELATLAFTTTLADR
ncbi:MAG: hypothetical protein OQJ98_02875 [Candidatus Pacebacteria bacterium]|nr:hypothetical protein [Candidatus Paceibacterota bacterium]